MEETFTYTVAEHDNVIEVTLKGRLDTTTANILDDYISNLESTDKQVILDCKLLVYISSAGLRVFLKFSKKLGANVQFININSFVYDILEITGLSEILQIVRLSQEEEKVVLELLGLTEN